ncbi:syntaxin-123-like [Telopea speciosissima]|uniref:syntaxin-123-like n=1 Tax=Telopea speciosissima TaxID=54955 RepID=UPI001CC75777|nr:syntaxin-123-like [Telopea speciosissima]
MNGLFSSSFKKYTDLKRQAYLDDMESGGEAGKESVNLDRFFEDLGCGPDSSADRTRTFVVAGLGKKLKDMMDDFQGLRAKMNIEYKETVERRYFTITGQKADEETIENLISSGESENFLQKAMAFT